MCLLSKWRFPKKAKKDIICYKVFMNDPTFPLRTPCMNEIMYPHQMVYAHGSSLYLGHSKEKAHIKTAGYIHVLSFTVPIVDSYCIYKCIIPKDTRYHESICGDEYCAEKIYITNERVY